ncbi:MAG: hypothetical protein LBM95_08415 [Lactobacillales bacterium]|jgi:hypothetical protein|nr:hypothetical protein [Lactobacillales bacterium]
MNVNLLPKKYIKNRAMFVIAFVTSILSVILLLFLVGINLFYHLDLKFVEDKLQRSKVEGITLNKKIEELSSVKSMEIQAYLKDLKEKPELMSPIMKQFSEVGSKEDVELINYTVNLEGDGKDKTGNMQQGAFIDDSRIYVELVYRGDLLNKAGKVVEGLNGTKWVVTSSLTNASSNEESNDGKYDFVIQLILDKEKLPLGGTKKTK